MSSGPETRFYQAINRQFRDGPYCEKMHNVYRGGTPDVWYSGTLDDLWVEYKWLAKLPQRASIQISKLLSPLQLLWLDERQKEGRNVAVILGTPSGAWIYENLAWHGDVTPAEFAAFSKTKQQVADYIRRRTMV